MELQLPPATGGQQQAAESHAVDIHLRPSAVAAPDEDDDGESSAQRRPVDVDVQSRPAPVGDVADDCHVVNIEPQSVAIQLIALVGDTESSSGCHVIVDAKPPDSGNGAAAAAAAADEDDENCCVVCTDPLVLAAVGRCGHRVVCRKCAVRLRFFYRNKRCCICRAYCFKVTITNKAADATTTIMPPLLFLAFWEGRVTGKYWYHRHTAAFFEDEEEYKAAKKACQGILTPFYKPVIWFMCFLYLCVSVGVFYGWTVRTDKASRVRTRVLSITIAVLVFTIGWAFAKSLIDPLHVETCRLARQRERQQL